MSTLNDVMTTDDVGNVDDVRNSDILLGGVSVEESSNLWGWTLDGGIDL